jgi:hypothetical protein
MTEKRMKALLWLFDVHVRGLSGEEADKAGGVCPSRRMFDLLCLDWLIDGLGRPTQLGLRALDDDLKARADRT